MVELFLMVLYIIGFIFTSKLYVKLQAISFPELGWDGGDTITCVVCSAFWPIAIFPLSIAHINVNKYITVFPFKKWFDKELEKRKK